MSIFIIGQLVSKNKLKVLSEHNFPELLSDEFKKNGFTVDVVPQPEIIVGKIPIKFYNTETKQIYYEYEDEPIDEMTALKNQLTAQSQKLSEQEQAIMELTAIIAGGGTNV